MIDVLINILYLDRESAIAELTEFKKLVSPSEFKHLTKQLSRHHRTMLIDINTSEVNRRTVTRYGGFKLGDKVRSTVYHASLGETLTIVEFYAGWVICLRSGDVYSPALLPEDLELCSAPESNGKQLPYSSAKSESSTTLKADTAILSSSRSAMASTKS